MIAELSGIALTPGVSKNGRLYTPEIIQRAVARMKTRIADEHAQPLTMLSHHAAGDDSLRIVGRLTSAGLTPLGSVTFEATLADTDAAKSIAALITPKTAYLRNVSIRGHWIGPVRTVIVDGRAVETADDLEILGVDFTKDPGVEGAVLTSSSLTESRRAGEIFENLQSVIVDFDESDAIDYSALSESDLAREAGRYVLGVGHPATNGFESNPFWASAIREAQRRQ